MAKIRNVSPFGDLDVPLLGRIVEAGAVVDVDDEHAAVLLQQTANWADANAQPPGNASRDEWVAYALGHGYGPEDLDGKSRDDIRALFTTTTTAEGGADK